MAAEQLGKAIKATAQANQRQARQLWIAIAGLGLLMIVVVVALVLNLRATSGIAAALGQNQSLAQQQLILNRCIAVLNYQGDSDPRKYEQVLDYCIAADNCRLQTEDAASFEACLRPRVDEAASERQEGR